MDTKVTETPPIIVPHDRLHSDTLRKVVEEFVCREGTDYGAREVPFDTKCRSIHAQLQSGRAVLLFDPGTSTTTIVAADDPLVRVLCQHG